MPSGYYKLIFVSKTGELDTATFDRQPTTNDIEFHAAETERFAIQRIGDRWEVYDLKTLRTLMGSNVYTIGLPIFTHEDEDAAITYAVLMAGRE